MVTDDVTAVADTADEAAEAVDQAEQFLKELWRLIQAYDDGLLTVDEFRMETERLMTG